MSNPPPAPTSIPRRELARYVTDADGKPIEKLIQDLEEQQEFVLGTLPAQVVTAQATADAALLLASQLDADLGDYVSSTVLVGAMVALVSGTPVDITSIILPNAGDWEVSAAAMFSGNVASTVTRLEGSISLVSNTLDTAPGNMGNMFFPAGTLQFNTSTRTTVNVGSVRLSVAGPTTVFLVGVAAFGVSTAGAYGILRAWKRKL